MTRTREGETNLSTKLQALNDKIRHLKEIPPRTQLEAILYFINTSCLPTETDCHASGLNELLSISRTYVFARLVLILSPKQFQSLISQIERAEPIHCLKEINLRELRRNPSWTIREHIKFIMQLHDYRADEREFYPKREDIPQIPEDSQGLQADIIRAWQRLLASEAH